MKTTRPRLVIGRTTRFIIVILAAFLYAVLVFSREQTAFQDSPSKITSLRGYLRGEASTNDSRLTESAHMEAWVDYTLPTSAANNELRVSTKSVVYYADKNLKSEGQTICLDGVMVLENYFGRNSPSTVHSAQRSAFPACFELGSSGATIRTPIRSYDIYYLTLPETGTASVGLLASPNNYWYPYDGIESEIGLVVEYRTIKDGKPITNTAISPFINAITPPTSVWRTFVHTGAGATTADPMPFVATNGIELKRLSYNVSVLKLDRPIVYRIAFPLTVSAMVLFIALLSLVDSLDAYLAGSIAILFGIFGIRQTLLPPGIQSNSMVDVIILGFYVLLIFVSLMFAGTVISKRSKP